MTSSAECTYLIVHVDTDAAFERVRAAHRGTAPPVPMASPPAASDLGRLGQREHSRDLTPEQAAAAEKRLAAIAAAEAKAEAATKQAWEADRARLRSDASRSRSASPDRRPVAGTDAASPPVFSYASTPETAGCAAVEGAGQSRGGSCAPAAPTSSAEPMDAPALAAAAPAVVPVPRAYRPKGAAAASGPPPEAPSNLPPPPTYMPKGAAVTGEDRAASTAAASRPQTAAERLAAHNQAIKARQAPQGAAGRASRSPSRRAGNSDASPTNTSSQQRASGTNKKERKSWFGGKKKP